MSQQSERAYRTKQLDPDFRPNTYGMKNPCCRCSKEIKTENHRMVHVIDCGFSVLHPEDEQLYQSDEGDLYFLPIGNDCARKLGLEWSVKLEGGAA